MSNISLELNFELYQHLVDIYNIPQDDYAASHVFNAEYINNQGDVSSGYGDFSTYGNRPIQPLNENALMSILFSKIYTDQFINIDVSEYIDYILKENYSSYIDYAGVISVYYYEDNMNYIQTNTEKPYINEKIIDFDISSYASYNIRHYLLYLDIVAQIYKYAYERKKNKQTIITEQIDIQARYAVNYGQTQLNRSERFNITLKPIIAGIDNKVIDIEYTADKNVSSVFITFKLDIIKHFKYLSGEDVRLTGLSYLKTIEYFYKFCRLRLMYLIAHSIRLLNDPIGNVQRKFNNFILEEVLAVFTNFRQKINNEIIQSNNAKVTKNILYNKSVLETSTKLQDINDQIIANRDSILNNMSLLANIDNQYANTYRVHLIATVILFITIFFAIILASIGQIEKTTKGSISLGITIILIIFIIVLYVVTNNVIEMFNQERENIRFPRAILIGPKTKYTDGTIVNVKSSANSCAYSLFNYQRVRTNLSNVCLSGWTDTSTNSWIAIDLGEYVYVTSFDIIINETHKTTTAPKKFTLYGSKYLSAYTTPYTDSAINTKWNLIQINEFIFNEPSSSGLISKNIIIESNDLTDYPYYMFVINNTQNNARTVNIKHLQLYGYRNYTISPPIRDTISSVSIGSRPNEFTERQLPIDYNDNKLLSWDLTVTAKETSSECVSLSIGTFCFNSSRKIEVVNQTSALDPYGSQYITGIVEAVNTNLSDVAYSLVIRYFPTVIDTEQLANTADFNNLGSAIDAIKNQRDTVYAALETTSNILRSSNIKIADYIDRISDLIDTSNKAKAILGDWQTYTQLKRDYETSNDMLYNSVTGIIATSNRYLQDLAISEQKLKDAQRTYDISNALNIELTQKFGELKGNIMTSINYFRIYMDQSERSLADSIQAQILVGEVEKVKVKIARLADVGKDKVDELSQNIVLQEAEARRQEAEKKAEISAKTSSASFLNSEAYDLELENKRIEIAIDGSSIIFDDLGDKVSQEITRRDTAKSQIDEATSDRKTAETSGISKLSELNIKYNTNYASLDELKSGLDEKLKNEKALKAAALQEYDDVAYEQKVAEHKLNNANTMIAFYDALSHQTNATIDIYDGYVQDFEQKLQDLHKEKLELNATLDSKKKASQEKIDAALTAYDDIDNRTFQDILMLKVQQATLLHDIAKRRSEEAEKYQQFLAKRKEKDTAQEKYDAIVQQKQAEESTRDYYKSVQNAIKDDVDISIVIKDIDVMIVYSITDNINGINYDLITPSMSSEYYEFDKYRKSMQLSAHQSEFNINDKLLGIRAMEARTLLFLNLAVIIMICMTVYYYTASNIAVFIGIIATIIAIVIYSVKLKGPVRSRARNYYWN